MSQMKILKTLLKIQIKIQDDDPNDSQAEIAELKIHNNALASAIER